MSLLTVCQKLALNVGLAQPTAIIGNTAREWIEAVHFAEEAGEEIARRVDWGALSVSEVVVSTGGSGPLTLTQNPISLDQGVTVNAPGIVRPLTRGEWNTLTQVEGTPRYFLLQGNKISFWPYLAVGATAAVSYKTGNWATNGARFVADTDTTKFPEELLLKGLILRWRKQKGMDFVTEEADYESALADYAAFDDRSRL
jgi:hypothetical protein